MPRIRLIKTDSTFSFVDGGEIVCACIEEDSYGMASVTHYEINCQFDTEHTRTHDALKPRGKWYFMSDEYEIVED